MIKYQKYFNINKNICNLLMYIQSEDAGSGVTVWCREKPSLREIIPWRNLLKTT